jgi:hypothetical protein
MRLELRKDRPEGERPRAKPEPPPMTSPFESSILQARQTDTEPPRHRPAQGSHA